MIFIGGEVLPIGSIRESPVWIPGGSAPPSNINLIAHTGKGSEDSNFLTTDAIDTTGSDFLVAILSASNAGAPTALVDNKGNVWIPKTAYTVGGTNGFVQLYYSTPITTGSGHTLSIVYPGNPSYSSLCFAAFSGLSATPFDAENGNATTASSIQPGSLTPSVDGCLLISGIVDDNSPSIDSGFSIIEDIPLLGSIHWGSAMAYKTQTSLAAENPLWTLPGAFAAAANITSFKSV